MFYVRMTDCVLKNRIQIKSEKSNSMKKKNNIELGTQSNLLVSLNNRIFHNLKNINEKVYVIFALNYCAREKQI